MFDGIAEHESRKTELPIAILFFIYFLFIYFFFMKWLFFLLFPFNLFLLNDLINKC